MSDEKLETLHAGKYLNMVREGTWEYVQRTNKLGAVVIVALTPQRNVLFVEQYRPPMGKNVIELPAGLAGDRQEFEGEQLSTAAERELLEETGYAAEQMEYLTHGPPSAGMSSETVTFFRATGLRKVADGGGDESEDITIHEVPVGEVGAFLDSCQKQGKAIDPKVFTGLYFLGLGASAPQQEISIEIPAWRGPQLLDSPIGLNLADGLLQDLDTILPPLPGNGNVGIMGGSFNPPHVGHALLAHAMLATEALDALWIMPVAAHPFGKDSVSFEHRVEMCRIAFRHLPQVRVIEIEEYLPKPSFTVQTLSALHAVRPGIKPTLIIGSDIIPELPLWRDPEKLPELSNMVVVPRQGAPEIEPRLDLPIKIYQGFRLPKVSSSAIKKALQSGGDVDGLLDLRVEAYVDQHRLYSKG